MYGLSRLDGKGDVDLEKGTGSTLYPGLSLGENELRWAFIRKVYSILAAQLLLTSLVAAFTVLYTPLNLALTASPGLALGLGILPFFRRLVLEALILTSGVVLALTGYTFWAARKGQDFGYLEPILFACLIVLVLTGFIQIFFPLGSMALAIYSGFGALLFSAYLVYDTDQLIKRFTYDDYIWASVALYLDILNLFLYILQLLRSSDS